VLIWSTKMPGARMWRPDIEGWHKILKASGEFEHSTFWLNDRATKLEQIVSEARRWHAKNVRGRKDRRGLVFVDYAQMITVQATKGYSREQEVARISKTMKGLAAYLDVPVVLLAQLNREVERRGGAPVLADLRESGAIEQDADIVLFPYRAINAEKPEEKNLPGPAEIIVAKNRDGKIGAASVTWTPELMTFRCQTEQEPPRHFTEREDSTR